MRTTRIAIDAPDGAMPAFVASPDAAEGRPGVVVLMEAFGLVPSIESVARLLAEEGYVALAPDLFYRELPDNTAAYDDIPRGMELMGKLVARGGKFLGDVEAAMAYLEGHSAPAIGIVGFCMGGALTFATACAFPGRIAAAASFYGAGIVDLLDRAHRIECPLMFAFAERDVFIPLDEVRRIETRLRELGKDVSVRVYADADHGFFNAERPSVYHPHAAREAWEELRRFFERHLKGVV